MLVVRILLFLGICLIVSSCSVQESTPDKLLREAHQLAGSGQLAEAEKVYNDPSFTTSPGPYRLAALMGVAQCYIREQKNSEALMCCREASKLCGEVYGSADPLNASILLMTANSQAGLKNYDEAIRSCNLANSILDQPSSLGSAAKALVQLTLADVNFRKRDLPEAIRIYESINLPPMKNAIAIRLATCYSLAGNKMQAKACMNQAVESSQHGDYPGMSGVFDAYLACLKESGDSAGEAQIEKEKQKWLKDDNKAKELLDRMGESKSRLQRIRRLKESELLHLGGEFLSTYSSK